MVVFKNMKYLCFHCILMNEKQKENRYQVGVIIFPAITFPGMNFYRLEENANAYKKSHLSENLSLNYEIIIDEQIT